MLDINSPAMKVFMGKELTEEETKQLNEENIKRALVKFLCVEKMKDLGVDIKGFSFTPGDNWMNVPTIDIVSELLKFHEAVENGNIKPLNFADSRLKKADV